MPGLLTLRAWHAPEQASIAAQGSASLACNKEHSLGGRLHSCSITVPPQWLNIARCSCAVHAAALRESTRLATYGGDPVPAIIPG